MFFVFHIFDSQLICYQRAMDVLRSKVEQVTIFHLGLILSQYFYFKDSFPIRDKYEINPGIKSRAKPNPDETY